MRTHALWTFMSGLTLLACIGCSMTDTGSTIRGQAPSGHCGDGTCYSGGCFNGGCNDGSCNVWNNGFNGSLDDGWCKDKWSQSNVHHYTQSMVPQCRVGTAMPMMVQYPYYTVKGPDCFFYGGK